MEGEGGLSLKERMKLLQSNTGSNPLLSGELRQTSKPTPPPASAKPVALKPVTPINSAKEGLTPPPTPAKPGAIENGKVNGPATPGKPFVGLKSPAKLTKPDAIDSGDTGSQDTPKSAFNQGSEGSQSAGKVLAPLVPKKPGGFHGASGVTPLVPKKPGALNGTGELALPVPKKLSGAEGSIVTTSVTMKDEPDGDGSTKCQSIKDRLALFNQSSNANGADSEDKQHHDDSASPKSPVGSVLRSKFSAFAQPNNTDVCSGSSNFAKNLEAVANKLNAGKDRKSVECSLRHSDGKRFRKIDFASVVSSEPAPAKPAAISDVDLTPFVKAFAKAKENKLNADASKCDTPDAGAGDREDLYIDADSSSVTIRPKSGGPVNRTSSACVSLIPELAEEEEEQMYTDSQSAVPSIPEEEYSDCTSALQQVETEDPDEIYEPLDDELPPPPPSLKPLPPPPSPNPSEDKKAKKKEKEKGKDKNEKKKDKAKEEENKKQEKERKKKEEELKKQRAKFGLTDKDEKIGDGIVKHSASSSVFHSKDLAVSTGEMVTILRINGNPAGKWLVQNEQGKLGFINPNNVEVATPAIRSMMTGAMQAEHGGDEEAEATYELEGEMDEVYEEL